MGMVMIRLATAMMVNAACQLSPARIMYEARIYVGMHTAMPTHSAARCQRFQVRWGVATGARSALYRREAVMSGGKFKMRE